jgi:metallo-beta-lactamase class B
MLKTRSLLLALILLMAGGTANAQISQTAAAEATPMAGCGPSSTINALFTEFGRTGKMPEELGKWLNNSEIQSIPPLRFLIMFTMSAYAGYRRGC